MALDLKLVRSNLPPRTIMRGPGFLNAVLIIERVMEHVAQTLGLDSCLVRERNFLQGLSPPQVWLYRCGLWHWCSVQPYELVLMRPCVPVVAPCTCLLHLQLLSGSRAVLWLRLARLAAQSG